MIGKQNAAAFALGRGSQECDAVPEGSPHPKNAAAVEMAFPETGYRLSFLKAVDRYSRLLRNPLLSAGTVLYTGIERDKVIFLIRAVNSPSS
jgi:hypothetical protein